MYRSDISMVRSIKNFQSAQQILEIYRKIFKVLRRGEGGSFGGGRWGQGRREVVGVVAGGVAGTETPSVTLV